MSKLISGKEALIALANGIDVECSIAGENEWIQDIYGIKPYYFLDGDVGQFYFRLKPRTITLNGVEVPAPFEPKEGDEVWNLSSNHDGYVMVHHHNSHKYAMAVWRTEEEIKQVVAALRQVFGGEGFLGNTQLSKLKPSIITINGVELNRCYSLGIDRIKNEISIQFKDESDADRLYALLTNLFGFRG